MPMPRPPVGGIPYSIATRKSSSSLSHSSSGRGGAQFFLILETGALVNGVVEFGEGVGYLHAVGERLEAFHQPVVVAGSLGERGDPAPG